MRARGNHGLHPGRMRQLSDAGRDTARAIGAAIRDAAIPVGAVFASPYCRTRETAALLGLGAVQTTTDVMNTRAAEFFGGRETLAARARQRLSVPPPPDTNVVFVAHGNIVREATGEYPDEAGAIVFLPVPGDALHVAARLEPEDWPRLVNATSAPGATRGREIANRMVRDVSAGTFLD